MCYICKYIMEYSRKSLNFSVPNSCPLRQFSCKNGNCIPMPWVCDGTDDCKDNSDESPTVCKRKLNFFFYLYFFTFSVIFFFFFFLVTLLFWHNIYVYYPCRIYNKDILFCIQLLLNIFVYFKKWNEKNKLILFNEPTKNILVYFRVS